MFVPSGRWGSRRVRVTECRTARAEALYTALVRGGHTTGPGAHGQASWKFGDAGVTADWEIRANRIWKYGRVFLRCGRCQRRATRLYLPVPSAPALFACRRCLGLTYGSRVSNNYKDRLLRGLGGLGVTHRLSAHLVTLGEQARRREASLARQAERRPLSQQVRA